MQCAAVTIQRLLSTTPPQLKAPFFLSMTCHGQAPRAAVSPLMMYGPTFVMFGDRWPQSESAWKHTMPRLNLSELHRLIQLGDNFVARDGHWWSPVSIQTQSLALRALRALRLDGNRAKRKRLRWQAVNHGWHCFDRAFLSKRYAHNARNASDCVWIETGL